MSDIFQPPFANEIISYALSQGVINPRFEHRSFFGRFLLGEGETTDKYPRSLVNQVASDLSIQWGGGSGNRTQIRPENFKLPVIEVERS